MIDLIVFVIAGAIVLVGALGVISFGNPVHAALSLIASFFGVAVVFIVQEAHFLALVQVVVYAGAIVVLFLFVIMLLGVDTAQDLRVEPLVGQRPLGLFFGALVLALTLGGLFLSGPAQAPEGLTDANGQPVGRAAITGQESVIRPIDDRSQIEQLGEDLFTRNILAFQATALLLTIATVGAVVLVNNKGGEEFVIDEPGTSVE